MMPPDSGMAGFPALVLFDLDGTLLDSAPDFVATINRMRGERGEPAISLANLRPHRSRITRQRNRYRANIPHSDRTLECEPSARPAQREDVIIALHPSYVQILLLVQPPIDCLGQFE